MQKAVVFGCGGTARKYKDKIYEQFDVVAYTSNHSESWGTIIDGVQVIPPAQIPEDAAIVVASNYYLEIIHGLDPAHAEERQLYVLREGQVMEFRELKNERGYLPQMLSINFTEECNLRCVWCYFHGISGREINNIKPGHMRNISDETLAAIIDSVRGIRSIHTLVYATAGELFMNRRWFEQVSTVLRELPNIKKFILTTNGMMLDEANAEKLIKLNVDQIEVNFSIDGDSPQETEKYRVNSSYDKIRENIYRIQSRTKDSGKFTFCLQSYHPLQKGETPERPHVPDYLQKDFPGMHIGYGIVVTPDLERDDFSAYQLKSVAIHRKLKIDRACYDPFENMYFDCLGNMRMCACGQFSHQLIIGKAGENCLDQWQNSEIMTEVRQKLLALEPCRYCGHCTMQNIDPVHYLCAE